MRKEFTILGCLAFVLLALIINAVIFQSVGMAETISTLKVLKVSDSKVSVSIARSLPPIPTHLLTHHQSSCKKFLSAFKTNGQQMMPLGFYAMVDYIRDADVLKGLKRSGFNLVHKYNSRQSIEDAYLDLKAAQQAHIGVLQNLPKAYITNKDLRFWNNHVSSLAQNENIKVWYLPEERKQNEFDRLRDLIDIIRAHDKSQRPITTYFENSNTSYLREAAKILDTIIFGAYPTMTPHRPRADLKRRIDKAYECGAGMVIAAVEALEHKGRWTRPQDIRFDAYLALISGAKGLMWYCYYYAHRNDALFEEISKVAYELNGPMGLGEVLLLGNPDSKINCTFVSGALKAPPASAYENRSSRIQKTYNSIQWTVRQFYDSMFIFVVNMSQNVGISPKPKSNLYTVFRFDSIPTEYRTATSLFENRTISIQNGEFYARLAPLETCVYKLERE
jgi:hypothetical protein